MVNNNMFFPMSFMNAQPGIAAPPDLIQGTAFQQKNVVPSAADLQLQSLRTMLFNNGSGNDPLAALRLLLGPNAPSNQAVPPTTPNLMVLPGTTSLDETPVTTRGSEGSEDAGSESHRGGENA